MMLRATVWVWDSAITDTAGRPLLLARTVAQRAVTTPEVFRERVTEDVSLAWKSAPVSIEFGPVGRPWSH